MKRVKSKLITTLLAVTMAFSLTACGVSQDNLDSAVTPLSEQITTINATLTEMQTLDTTLDGYIDTLETKVATLETDLTAVNTTLESLEENSATKTALLETKTALESEINTIKADITALKAKDTELDGKITELETALSTEITDTETWIEETFATKTACDTLKTEINASLATLQTKMDGLEDSIDNLETTVNGLQQDIKDLENRIDEIEAEFEELKKQMNCLAGNHVIDTEKEISCAWSDDYSTCTATGVCVHCDNEAIQTANGVVGENKITATFENLGLETQIVHTVTTYNELNTLLQSGETVTIRLDATLENIQNLFCHFGTTAVLDMNGNDIIFEPGYFLGIDESSLTLKGAGSITASGTVTINCRGLLSIEEGITINSDWRTIPLEGYSYLDATVIISGGTINAPSNGTNFHFVNDYTSLTITGGTFSHDPSEYVDLENYAVTENENGTWTVTAK